KQGVTSIRNRAFPKPSVPLSRPFPVNPVKPTTNTTSEEHVDRGSANAHAAITCRFGLTKLPKIPESMSRNLKKTDGKLMTLGMREELLRTKIIKQVSTFSEPPPGLRIAPPSIRVTARAGQNRLEGFRHRTGYWENRVLRCPYNAANGCYPSFLDSPDDCCHQRWSGAGMALFLGLYSRINSREVDGVKFHSAPAIDSATNRTWLPGLRSHLGSMPVSLIRS